MIALRGAAGSSASSVAVAVVPLVALVSCCALSNLVLVAAEAGAATNPIRFRSNTRQTPQRRPQRQPPGAVAFLHRRAPSSSPSLARGGRFRTSHRFTAVAAAGEYVAANADAGRSCRSTSRSSSSVLLSAMGDGDGGAAPSPSSPFRILALHGKGDDAFSFGDSLAPLLAGLEAEAAMATTVECDALPAPFDGGKWWEQVPPGSRSYEADAYDGYDESSGLVRGALSSARDDGRCYDAILGHSQGAILLASMLANGDLQLSPDDCAGDREGVVISPPNLVLNGVAWPKPYEAQLASLRFDRNNSPSSTPSLRMLFVIGENDGMNPPDGARWVRDAFLEIDGVEVDTLDHPGGHSVPVGDGTALRGMVDWLAEGAPAPPAPRENCR